MCLALIFNRASELYYDRTVYPTPPVCLSCLGEQYCTTYEAVGEVRLAVMAADDFHACIDRAIVSKSNATAGGGGTERGGDGSCTATAGGGDSQNSTRRVIGFRRTAEVERNIFCLRKYTNFLWGGTEVQPCE